MTGSSSVITNACSQGIHVLEFIHYIQSLSVLTSTAEELGLLRLADSPLIQQLTNQLIYSATCDGAPMMIVPPSFYIMPSGVTAFGYVMGCILLVVCAISAMLVMKYSDRMIIRSSSSLFLGMMLVGLGLMSIALIAWSYGPVPTIASCGLFNWFANLGFMCMFTPLFAKTYRVYRIFSGSKLKVIKISNFKLMVMTLSFVGLDFLLLCIWQGVSPLKPMEYCITLSDRREYYTHCSIDTSTGGMAFVILEGR